MRTCFSAILVVRAVAVGLVGCQSSAPSGRTLDAVPRLDAAVASAIGLTTEQVSDATALYTVKCAKCHKFYDPTQYSQPEWDMWMQKMSRKSKLKPAQEELLARYLGAYRASHR